MILFCRFPEVVCEQGDLLCRWPRVAGSAVERNSNKHAPSHSGDCTGLIKADNYQTGVERDVNSVSPPDARLLRGVASRR